MSPASYQLLHPATSLLFLRPVLLHVLLNFFAMHANIPWRFDPDSCRLTFDGNQNHFNQTVCDDDFLTYGAFQNQHDRLPFRVEFPYELGYRFASPK